MKSFSQYYKQDHRGPIPTLIQKEIDDDIRGIEIIKRNTELTPISYKWKIQDLDKFRNFITKVSLNPQLEASGNVAYRMCNNTQLKIQLIKEKQSPPFFSIEYPIARLYNINQSARAYVFHVAQNIDDIIRTLYSFKFKVLNMHFFIKEDHSDFSMLKRYFALFNTLSKIDKSNLSAVMNGLSYYGLSQKEIFKARIKLGVPVSDKDMTDDLLAGIV